MLTKIKNKLNDNKAEVVIFGLGFAVGILGYNLAKTKIHLQMEFDNMQVMLDNIDAGFTPTIDWDKKLVIFSEPKACHCPTEKPKAEKTPKAA